MGEPVDFPEANFTFNAPAGMEDEVLPLRVRRLEGRIVSRWIFTDAELQEIVRTRGAWLEILGHGMPPVMVTGHRADVI